MNEVTQHACIYIYTYRERGGEESLPSFFVLFLAFGWVLQNVDARRSI